MVDSLLSASSSAAAFAQPDALRCCMLHNGAFGRVKVQRHCFQLLPVRQRCRTHTCKAAAATATSFAAAAAAAHVP